MLMSELLKRLEYLLSVVGDVPVDQAIVTDVIFQTDENIFLQQAFKAKDKQAIKDFQTKLNTG